MTSWAPKKAVDEARADDWLTTAKASTGDWLKSTFGYGNDPAPVVAPAPPQMDIQLPSKEEWHKAAPWRDLDPPKQVPTPSGTPSAMPTAPGLVDATITSGPRPGQTLQPGESVGSVTLGDSQSAGGGIDNSSRATFVRTAYPHMLQAAGGDPKLAQWMLAKAISENGDVGSGSNSFIGNNFAGIKGKGPTGKSFTARTWEMEGGQRVYQDAEFAAFDTPQEGMGAFMSFLRENSRYHPALQRYQQTGDARQLFQDINSAGYATNPRWWADVESILSNDVAPNIPRASVPRPSDAQTLPYTPADAQRMTPEGIPLAPHDDPNARENLRQSSMNTGAGLPPSAPASASPGAPPAGAGLPPALAAKWRAYWGRDPDASEVAELMGVLS